MVHSMISRPVVLAVAALVTLSGVLAQTTTFPDAPTYNGQPLLFKTFSLPYTPYATFNPNFALITGVNVSAPHEGYPSFSADLFAVGDGTFYAISNRGPFVSCGPSSEYLAYPALDPTAIRFQLTYTEPSSTGSITVYNPLSYYWLRVSDGNYLYDFATGLSASVTYYNSSSCSSVVQPAFVPGHYIGDGLDPGAFAVLKKAQAYLIGEGNLPSLVLTDSTGKFLQRYLPAYAPLDDISSQSPITRTLPGVLGKIRASRDIGGGNGFGGIAISQDERSGLAIFRRPLGDDTPGSTTQNANIHRVIALDLTDPLNLQVVGMYYYQTTPLSVWKALDPLTTAADIKVTAITRLDNAGSYLVLERGRSNSLVYVVNFTGASNVINDPESLYIPILINEVLSSSGQPIPWVLPHKTLLLDLSTSGVNSSIAAEGLVILSDSIIGLTADNGWQSAPFQIYTIQLGSYLPTRSPVLTADTEPAIPYFTTGTRSDAGVAASANTAASATPTTTTSPTPALPNELPHTFTLNFNLGGIVQN